jgi:hypothetical protein
LSGETLAHPTLRERNKGPTVRNCADGNLSGPSVQHENKVDKQDRCRHIIAIGIGRAVPYAAVGTAYADGLAVGTDFLFVIMVELCLRPPSAQIFFCELFVTRPKHFVN